MLQAFYQDIKRIKLFDPLALVLGSSSNGEIEFGFSDIVKIQGHGCPTVGGAYLMAYHGLKHLYGHDLPIRGQVEVFMKNRESDGVTGVIANVICSIVGAAGEGGFKGLGGQYSRHNLLHYGHNQQFNVCLKRLDTKAAVEIAYRPEIVRGNPDASMYLEKILIGIATKEDKTAFQTMWNERLKKIMVDEFDNPDLIILSAVTT